MLLKSSKVILNTLSDLLRPSRTEFGRKPRQRVVSRFGVVATINAMTQWHDVIGGSRTALAQWYPMVSGKRMPQTTRAIAYSTDVAKVIKAASPIRLSEADGQRFLSGASPLFFGGTTNRVVLLGSFGSRITFISIGLTIAFLLIADSFGCRDVLVRMGDVGSPIAGANLVKVGFVPVFSSLLDFVFVGFIVQMVARFALSAQSVLAELCGVEVFDGGGQFIAALSATLCGKIIVRHGTQLLSHSPAVCQHCAGASYLIPLLYQNSIDLTGGLAPC